MVPCFLLGCLLAWTLVQATCFIFLSLSWVLSFDEVWQGFIINWKHMVVRKTKWDPFVMGEVFL
jgi:hypothetical protein